MESGKLRHSLTIEQPTETKDASGRVSIAWSTFATVYASITPSSYKYQVMADSSKLIASDVVRIRYIDGITEKMRFKLGSRVFSIISIKPDETLKRDLIILVYEVK